MTIETRSVARQLIMGKSVATHSSENPGAEGSLRAQPSVAGTPEAIRGTRPERETTVGELSFLGRSRKIKKSVAQRNATSTFYSPAELGRRVGTPRIQPKDVVSS